ncbi:hypothetical protein HK102_000156, partial [Quaeritorhiza haematococci]
MAIRTSAGVNDMVLLEDVSNDAILNCLHAHYRADEIYTYIGQVLISVNPYKMINGLYSPATLKRYHNKKEFQNNPHVFAIAERAYRAMVSNLNNECVIITGESGAGKTEAAKKIMEYVAEVCVAGKGGSGGDLAKVKKQILETNPLTEAFGNAKTLRNNNSSRFGKFMEIQFKFASPVGGKISTYLLEKSRVVVRLNGERNFHIFYQFLAGASANQRKDFKLLKPEQYSYLSNSGAESIKLPGTDDVKDFKETLDALKAVGLPPSAPEHNELFKILSAILLLGNVDFTAGAKDNSMVKDMAVVNNIASLLSVDPNALAKALTHRTISVGGRGGGGGGEGVLTNLKPPDARFARDSLAKNIYGRLFDYIIQRANMAIAVPGSAATGAAAGAGGFTNTIGILDIYGFEIFENNSFEQLCINFVNEKLQLLFVDLTLKAEQEEYKREGIEWENVQYQNNLPVCELIEKRGNLFSLLDEECIFPNGTDQSFHTKIRDCLRAKEFNPSPAGKTSNTQLAFSVKHYAGEVVYSAIGFLEKNKDTLFTDLVKLMVSSKSSLLRQCFAKDAERDMKKKPVTSATQFKDSVDKLMTALRNSKQHYIRTIKPNEKKQPGVLDTKMVGNQIKYLGLLENLKVRRAGYSFRMKFESFVGKYKSALKDPFQKVKDQDLSEVSTRILKDVGSNDYQCGKTKIFIKSPKTVLLLEDTRKKFLDQASALIPKTKGAGKPKKGEPPVEQEELVFADHVCIRPQNGSAGFGEKKKKGGPETQELIFVWATRSFMLFDPKKKSMVARWELEQLQSMSIGDSSDGFLLLHLSGGGKGKKKGSDDGGEHTDLCCEGVFKSEVKNAIEAVLSVTGVKIECNETDLPPEPQESEEKKSKG